MNVEQRSVIPVGRAQLWDFLMDVPQMALCIPGVEEVTPTGEDQYAGRMRVKVGPINLALQGTMTVEERDRENWRSAMRGDANDRRVGGGIHAIATMTLVERSPTETELVVQADARLLGKLGEFGQPVIRKLADGMMAEFARNLAAHFEEPGALSRDSQ